MTYHRAPPPEHLRRLIDCFTYWEGKIPSEDKMTVMATRALSMQIDLHDTELRWYSGEGHAECHRLKGVTLAGPHTRPFGIDAHQARIVRARFRPGGASPFFRASPKDFLNAHISLEDVWGPEAARLQQRMAEAGSADEVVRILADALTQAATRELRNHPVVSHALVRSESRPDDVTVSGLADDMGLSAKMFSRIFAEEVGVTP